MPGIQSRLPMPLLCSRRPGLWYCKAIGLDDGAELGEERSPSITCKLYICYIYIYMFHNGKNGALVSENMDLNPGSATLTFKTSLVLPELSFIDKRMRMLLFTPKDTCQD